MLFRSQPSLIAISRLGTVSVLHDIEGSEAERWVTRCQRGGHISDPLAPSLEGPMQFTREHHTSGQTRRGRGEDRGSFNDGTPARIDELRSRRPSEQAPQLTIQLPRHQERSGGNAPDVVNGHGSIGSGDSTLVSRDDVTQRGVHAGRRWLTRLRGA